MKRLCEIALCLVFAGCVTTPPPPVAPPPPPPDKCATAEILGGFLAGQVSAALDCKNVPAIKKSMIDKIYQVGLCGEMQQGLPDLICGKLADLIRNTAVSAVPSAWECSGGSTLASMRDLLVNKCVATLTKKH